MGSNRRERRTGRGGGGRRRRAGSFPRSGPGEHGYERWAWLPLGLLRSESYWALSAHAQRALQRLLLEHGERAGRQNGRLIVTHTQFAAAGISKNYVRAALEELEAFGFISFTQGRFEGGGRAPSTYTLLWMDSWGRDGQVVPAARTWERLPSDEVAKIVEQQRERRSRI